MAQRLVESFVNYQRSLQSRPLNPYVGEVLIVGLLFLVAAYTWLLMRTVPPLFDHVNEHGWSLLSVMLLVPLLGIMRLTWEFKEMLKKISDALSKKEPLSKK